MLTAIALTSGKCQGFNMFKGLFTWFRRRLLNPVPKPGQDWDVDDHGLCLVVSHGAIVDSNRGYIHISKEHIRTHGDLVNRNDIKKCIICKYKVFTFEYDKAKNLLGGAELTSGEWVCSYECWDTATKD